ncbi:MAG: 3-dehydroquinate synthase [Anaerolineaceae bacterium]|nr:3-dehydroquinate synthase [Anaerolineaceae bacterium]
MMERIFLYGPPGVGKTTVAEKLAFDLKLPFYDIDAEIEIQAQESIPEIFSKYGEAGFRQLESEQILTVIQKSPAIVALGGGALLNRQNRDMVESNGNVICLNASLPILCERLDTSVDQRPLIRGDRRQKLKELITERQAHYASFPIQIDTSTKSSQKVVWQIQKKIGCYFVKGLGEGYKVTVCNGILDQISEIIIFLGIKGKIALVSDSNVGPLYLQQVKDLLEASQFEVVTHIFPAGEKNKKMQTISGMWHAFAEAKLDRGSVVIALGGGVVGDMAGFAAATYMRGIDWINVPTTLLSMADASVGGKTGFDLPQGKNLVGSFYPPREVIVDPLVLSTLPEEILREGMAEVLKHGVIASPDLFRKVQKGWPEKPEEIENIIREAIAVKVKVVQEDPFEKGVRAALNFGHTIGHAVELLSDFTIPHGEAVAIGMSTEARLASLLRIANIEFVNELLKTLRFLQLPIELPESMMRNEIYKAMKLDKKVMNGNIHFSLPVKIGEVKVGVVIENLEALLNKL